MADYCDLLQDPDQANADSWGCKYRSLILALTIDILCIDIDEKQYGCSWLRLQNVSCKSIVPLPGFDFMFLP